MSSRREAARRFLLRTVEYAKLGVEAELWPLRIRAGRSPDAPDAENGRADAENHHGDER